ncbi:MAG: hypothetical protein J6J44_04400 [Lachnospiraceae bacterium]|nr:hypothetical protein [Lachnospiraceae bacterium]
MIPWTLIIVGALCVIVGVLGLISLILLPIFERFEIVYDKDKEIIQARTDKEFGKHVRYEKKNLTRDFIICILLGTMMFFAGFYLGYAEKGENFWLYKKLFPDRVTVQVWDEINEAGQFVTEDGKAYTYYILVSGDEVSLSGLPCADMEDLEKRLSEVKRENTVIIYDSFAVSSTYREVKKILNKMGFDYEETR